MSEAGRPHQPVSDRSFQDTAAFRRPNTARLWTLAVAEVAGSLQQPLRQVEQVVSDSRIVTRDHFVFSCRRSVRATRGGDCTAPSLTTNQPRQTILKPAPHACFPAWPRSARFGIVNFYCAPTNSFSASTSLAPQTFEPQEWRRVSPVPSELFLRQLPLVLDCYKRLSRLLRLCAPPVRRLHADNRIFRSDSASVQSWSR